MKYCTKCVLSDNIFSVSINEDGVCNYCIKYENDVKNKTAQKREELNLDKYKNPGGYDVLLAYSGGKDSTYTLYLLREKYKLNVLTMTLDNGFVSNKTFDNIKNVTTKLTSDNIIIAPSLVKMKNIFNLAKNDDSLPKKSLERASSICTHCIGIVKSMAYKEAILRDIPLITFGWTPGQIGLNKQIVTLNYKMVKANFKHIRDTVINNLGDEYSPLYLTDDFIDKHKDSFPSLFYPFPSLSYDENTIFDTISKFGWEKPGNTDSNSTNCLMNSYAIKNHINKFGFHPYALELSQLVREGVITREEAFKRITSSKSQDEVASNIEILLND
ncbi:MAG: hypothetical protein FWC47_09810 [Oscillospiraceae bacterium]|nr:hypothetical protein [Oscillospiraceae bacterium]